MVRKSIKNQLNHLNVKHQSSATFLQIRQSKPCNQSSHMTLRFLLSLAGDRSRLRGGKVGGQFSSMSQSLE